MGKDAERLLKHDVIEDWARHLTVDDNGNLASDCDTDAWMVLAKLLGLGAA
jgi:hypothetical protein